MFLIHMTGPLWMWSDGVGRGPQNLRDLGRAMISNVSSHHVRGKNTFTKYFINNQMSHHLSLLFIAQGPELGTWFRSNQEDLEMPSREGSRRWWGGGARAVVVEELTLQKHTSQTSGITTSRSTSTDTLPSSHFSLPSLPP